MLRRRSPIAIALLALLLAGACSDGGDPVDVGGGSGDGDEEVAAGSGGQGGDLIAAISGEPDRLDPHLTSAYASFQVLENVYDTLVQPGDDLTMEPALAESWEVSEDDLTWTFDLRDGVTWHNGRDFVADDVVYSYERIMDPEAGAANAYRFEAVDAVTAPDDDTVVITLNRPAPNLLASIGGFKGVAIVPREIVEDGSIDTQPVGTGPFQFVSQSPDGEIVLEAYEDYWQEDLPLLDTLTFRPIPDPTVRLTNLQTGEVHWTDGVPPQQIEALESSDDVVVESVSGGDYYYLAMNHTRAPWDDVDVRRAVAFALDRDAITEAATFGAATPNQTAIPEGSFFYNDLAPFEQDVAQAEELLAGTAAADGATMELIVTNDYPETVTAAQVIADQLSEIGITVEIRELGLTEWFVAQGEGDFDAFLFSWIGNIDPDDFYYAQHRTDAGFNFHGYSNPAVDELLDAARQETDEDARKELYDEAVELLVNEVSYLYLYNPDVINAWLPEVKGYSTRPDSAIRFEQTYIEE